jgi:hypothetical protein
VPARTNPFQQVIAAIHRQFEGKDCKISESAMKYLNGRVAEVDVLIESTVAGHTVQVALECRCHRRKADVGWIEQMRGKYLDTGIRAVAVHCRGFTAGARKLAQATGIECISTSEAANKDWYEQLRRGHLLIVRPAEWQTRSPPRFYDMNGVLIPSDLSACDFTLENGLIVRQYDFIQLLLEPRVPSHVDAILSQPRGYELHQRAIAGEETVPFPDPLSAQVPAGVRVNVPTPPWLLRLSRVEVDLAVKLKVERPRHELYALGNDVYAAIPTTRSDGGPTTLLMKWDGTNRDSKVIAQINPPVGRKRSKAKRAKRSRSGPGVREA